MRFIVGCILFQLFYVLLGTCYLEGILDDYANNEAHVIMYYLWDKSTDFTWALLFWALYNTTLWNEKYYRQWLRNLIGIVAILLFMRTVCGYYVDTTKNIGLALAAGGGLAAVIGKAFGEWIMKRISVKFNFTNPLKRKRKPKP